MRKTGIITYAGDHKPEENRILEKYQLLEVEAATASQYRVRLPDGMLGMVASQYLERISHPFAQTEAFEQIQLLERPATDSSIITEIRDQIKIDILAKDQDHWYVHAESGRRGWMISRAL